MDKLKYIKLENEDGSYSDSIPIGAEASNVLMNNGKSVQSIIGDINVDIDGSIAEQLKNIVRRLEILEENNEGQE